MSNKYLDIAMQKVINQEVNKVLEDIKQEIEKAMGDFYYSEHDLGIREGFRFALEIIDNHIGKEQEQ